MGSGFLRVAHNRIHRSASLNTATFGTNLRTSSVTLEPISILARTQDPDYFEILPYHSNFEYIVRQEFEGDYRLAD